MTNSVTASPSPLPLTVSVDPTPSPEPASPPGAATPSDPRPQPEKRQPLTVDVARGDSGIFVYTLRDPATDTVVAVIPRQEVVVDRNGRNFDERV